MKRALSATIIASLVGGAFYSGVRSYRVAAVPDRDSGFALEADLGRKLRSYETSGNVRFEHFLAETLDELARARCRSRH